jgi:hypothetical protein
MARLSGGRKSGVRRGTREVSVCIWNTLFWMDPTFYHVFPDILWVASLAAEPPSDESLTFLRSETDNSILKFPSKLDALDNWIEVAITHSGG